MVNTTSNNVNINNYLTVNKKSDFYKNFTNDIQSIYGNTVINNNELITGNLLLNGTLIADNDYIVNNNQYSNDCYFNDNVSTKNILISGTLGNINISNTNITNVIITEQGSTTTPCISFSNTPNTGFYNEIINQKFNLNMTINGNQKLNINESIIKNFNSSFNFKGPILNKIAYFTGNYSPTINQLLNGPSIYIFSLPTTDDYFFFLPRFLPSEYDGITLYIILTNSNTRLAIDGTIDGKFLTAIYQMDIVIYNYNNNTWYFMS